MDGFTIIRPASGDGFTRLTPRDQGRAKSEQVWKRKLGSLTARNARGQTFEDFWQGYAKKNYDAEGRPAAGAPGGPTRAEAGAARDMASRDAARARREGTSPAQAALNQDRSAALIQGYGFGLADELMGARSWAKTAVLNALGQDQGYSAGDAFEARRSAEQARYQQYLKDHPVEGTANVLAGGFANPLNFVGGAVVQGGRGANAVARAAAVGGGMGAAYGAGGAEPGQRLVGAAKGGVTGAVVGGAVQGASNALLGQVARRAARPVTPQRQLSAQGVDLTPGQMLGGSAQRLEDAFTSVPFAGDAIREAQRRGIDSFDQVALNRVLAPIGGSVDDIGRAGMRDTSQQVSQAYQRSLNGVTVAPDRPFEAGIQAVRQTPNLPPAIRQDLDAFLGDVQARLAGPVDGATWKALDADLSAAIRAADAGSAQQPSQRFLRDALTRLREEVAGPMQRGHPQAYEGVRAADEATAMLARIRKASQYQGTAAREGRFTAGDLNRAVLGMDTSAGNRAYTEGRALLQDLAEPGVQVLPSTVPDSGTALRSAFTSSPQGLLVGGVTGIPATILYSRPVQTVLNAIYRAGNGPQANEGLQQLAQLAAQNPVLTPLVQELRARLAPPAGGQATAPTQLEAAPMR